VENKTVIIQGVLKMQQISFLPKCIKRISKGNFQHAFQCADASHVRANCITKIRTHSTMDCSDHCPACEVPWM